MKDPIHGFRSPEGALDDALLRTLTAVYVFFHETGRNQLYCVVEPQHERVVAWAFHQLGYAVRRHEANAENLP